MVVLEAIRLARVQNFFPCTIFSDSRSVLAAVTSKFDPNHSSFIILQIKGELKSLRDAGESCDLVWIPSHRGIMGNERADMLAREAFQVGADTQIGIPLKEQKNLWKNEMFGKLYDWCKEEGKTRGAYYCNNFLQKSQKPWFHKYKISRRTVTTLNRLRSGHTSLKESLFKFRMVDSPLCVSCGVEETSNHVFWMCPRFDEQRITLSRSLIKVRGFLLHSIEYLLATIDDDIIYALELFIDNIDINI